MDLTKAGTKGTCSSTDGKGRKVDRVALAAPTVHVGEEDKQSIYEWAEEMEFFNSKRVTSPLLGTQKTHFIFSTPSP